MIKTLLKQIREYRRDTIITPIFTVLEVVAELLVPFVIASLIDKGIEAGNLRNVYLYGALMIFLAAIVVLAAAVALIMSKAMKIFSHVFHRYDDLNASVQENISAIRVVKAFVREDYENEKFGKAAAKLYELFVSAEKLQALNLPVMMFIVYGCIIAISWFGARFIVAGSMTTGNLTSLFTYVMTAFSSLMMLSMIFVMMTMSAASGKRIAEVLEEKADITDPSKPLDRVKDGSIDFDHVTFSYRQGSGEETLSDIDLHIRSGETIGIIGGTGCGKSSLVSLISRLYDVTSGCVKVGGEDVRSYDLETLRNQVAVVLQKNVLFSGTVLDNLRWGKKMGHTEEYREACRPVRMSSSNICPRAMTPGWNGAGPTSPAGRSSGHPPAAHRPERPAVGQLHSHHCAHLYQHGVPEYPADHPDPVHGGCYAGGGVQAGRYGRDIFHQAAEQLG